jgi:4'-phosphopantetheinyl transferase
MIACEVVTGDESLPIAGRAQNTPARPMSLPHDEIHVWCASLDPPGVEYDRLAGTLSADERARAHRFHFERDRRRYVVGHGLLRAILGRYLDLEASEVRFRFGQHGKPFLAAGLGDAGLQFNMAHSHGLGLYALIRDHAVGVDIEHVRDQADLEQIAANFFSARENAALRALDADQRLVGFYNCWTRKEAYIKAIGEGLNYPLDQFDVSLIPGEPVRLLGIAGDEGAPNRWSLWSLEPCAGYVGALAIAVPFADREDYRLRMLAPPLL